MRTGAFFKNISRLALQIWSVPDVAYNKIFFNSVSFQNDKLPAYEDLGTGKKMELLNALARLVNGQIKLALDMIKNAVLCYGFRLSLGSF